MEEKLSSTLFMFHYQAAAATVVTWKKTERYWAALTLGCQPSLKPDITAFAEKHYHCKFFLFRLEA